MSYPHCVERPIHDAARRGCLVAVPPTVRLLDVEPTVAEWAQTR